MDKLMLRSKEPLIIPSSYISVKNKRGKNVTRFSEFLAKYTDNIL